jgi:glycosyltransferase involved in cell wall biosynthesis
MAEETIRPALAGTSGGETSMRVLLIHQNGGPRGSGAVIAMHRLHRGLQAAGVSSTVACRTAGEQGPDVVALPRADAAEKWLGRLTWRLGMRDVHCVSAFKLRRFAPLLDADVVNIHGWHTNYFSYLALPGIAATRPVVATLHDMWNLTGHCAVAGDCQRWRSGCGSCPKLDAFPPVPRDATALEWRLKRWVYGRSQMTVVAPSTWLADCAAAGILGRFDIRRIPNAIDTATFHPLDRAAARAALGLPQDRHVILFTAVSLADPNKGADLLLAALRQLPPEIRDRSTLLLAGQHGAALAADCPIPVHDLGYVGEEAQRIQAYAAADLLAMPSRMENLSLVLLEGLACGLPAVAFDTGGNRDVVRPRRSGFLARRDDTGHFAQGIARLLADRALRRELSSACRTIACSEYSIEEHVRQYRAVYGEAIESWRRVRQSA